MTYDKAIHVIATEKACLLRRDSCCHACGVCDLFLPTEDILEAYNLAIILFNMESKKKGKRSITELKEMEDENETQTVRNSRS